MNLHFRFLCEKILLSVRFTFFQDFMQLFDNLKFSRCGCGRLRSAHIDIPSIRGISTVNPPSPAVGITLQKVDENNKLLTEQPVTNLF